MDYKYEEDGCVADDEILLSREIVESSIIAAGKGYGINDEEG